MHTTVSPPHMTENQIRFKNLMHKAADELKARGDKQLADELCAQVDQRMGDMLFWESQTEGLLICARPGSIALFHLPIDTEEYVAVDSCYHLAPVLALLSDEQSFYVLTVNQHQPKLFSGSMYGLCEMEVGMPKSLVDSLNLDISDTKQQREQGRAKGEGANFNGRGGGHNPRDEERLRFFRLLDNIVINATERRLPLILAGTDSETTEYRTISKRTNILQPTLSGSFSDAKPHDLFGAAYSIIYSELIATRRQRAVEAYNRMQGTRKERIATDPLDIAEAASQGRIDTLLVALRQTTADTVHDTAKIVERITFPRAEISTLINKAANAVASARGRIINVERGAVGAPTPVMALLRY
jgi:hypothetical protein